jgi:DNA excision repair protein ERCC-3
MEMDDMSEREQEKAMTTYGMLTTVKELEVRIDEIRGLLVDLTEMSETIRAMKGAVAQKLNEYALAARVAGFKETELDQFFRKPYVLLPRKEHEWYLIVPRFIDLQVGWLERQTESFNIFVVNRYIDWITDIPQLIREELGFKPPLPIIVRGNFLYTDKDHIDEVWRRYRNHLSRREGDKIRIRKRPHFSLICALVRDGILPFDPKPVDPRDLIDRKPKFELDFIPSQKEAWNKFLHYGNLGVFWPPKGGKTFLGMHAMSHLKGKKLIIVPTVTLKEQWESRIKEYTNIPSSEYEIITYHASRKPAYLDKRYTLTIYDEVQHLPANIFSRLALLNTKYRIGLSATPFREDGHTELIFALSGFPIGLDWASFLKLQIIKKPTVDLHIVRNITEKTSKIEEILK